MFGSSTAIEGPPVVLLVDASRNLAGWESEVCDRMFTAMDRRGMGLAGRGPLRVSQPEDLKPHLQLLESANCLLLVGHGGETTPTAASEMRGYVAWLEANATGAKLLAVCSWESYDPDVSEGLLNAPSDLAAMALAQQSSVTAREGGLFLLKFFTELALHSEERVTGRMAWFSWSKARELLKRRDLPGTFGLRA